MHQAPPPAAPQMVFRHCTGCGARVELERHALSTHCRYCGSPMVDDARGEAHVDAVAPFRIERSVAQTRLREHLRKQFWAPRPLRRLDVGDHETQDRPGGLTLRPVLVPHFAYGGVLRCQYRAEVGIDYTTMQGKEVKRKVDWHPLDGSVARTFVSHLVSASVWLGEAESNRLEPFDLGWAKPFDARLLSGVEAELPTLEQSRADTTAVTELREQEARRVQHHLLPGDKNRLHWISASADIHERQTILLPVWILNYQHGEQRVRLLVNGQTGKCTGSVPRSGLKIALVVTGLVVAVGIAIGAIMLLGALAA